MAIRDSQDVSLAAAQNTGVPHDSQDVTFAIAQNTGAPRDSQDVTLAAARNVGAPRDSQDVILVLSQSIDRGDIANSQASQTLAVSGTVHGIVNAQASQTLDVAATESLAGTIQNSQAQQDLSAAAPQPSVGITDKPSIQVHPVIKPLDFSSRPLTQPGTASGSFTTLLTEAGANQAFSIPLSARNRPVAGKVFSFTMAGTMTPGTVEGNLTITPLYGATADGVNLGPSLAQPYAASTSAIPWRLKGEILFLEVDLEPGTSLIICTGSFVLNNLNLLFGSGNAVQIDTSQFSAAASGALNFAASFAPSAMNVHPPSIVTKYAFLRG
jgi:hypothetical protein